MVDDQWLIAPLHTNQNLLYRIQKFGLEFLSRDDLAALTTEAAKISGINYVMDVDKEEVDKILEV